jgi:flavin-dependent dehydrogenase
MAALGHETVLVERARFPRSHLGESLSAGVLPLLASIGVAAAIESAGFRRIESVERKWGADTEIRRDPHAEGFLVDRGMFDALLLENAQRHAVQVLQPACVREYKRDAEGWNLRLQTSQGERHLHAEFLADARGRSSSAPKQMGPRTIAFYAYWDGRRLPSQPRIEAGEDAWYWGVPLPNGPYNTLVFADHTQARSIAKEFCERIMRSGLMHGCDDAHLVRPILGADATPCVHRESVTADSIRIGDAAVAIDPLSSSGVQKAIQTALSGAIVANTLLRKPELREAALTFYRNSIRDASERHRRWAASYYAEVAATRAHSFWQQRAMKTAVTQAAMPAAPSRGAFLSLSREVEFVDTPCLEGDFVTLKTAVQHPMLEGPLAYLGGWELAPLLKTIASGMTAEQIVLSWSFRIPLQSALNMTGWLCRNGILVESGF